MSPNAAAKPASVALTIASLLVPSLATWAGTDSSIWQSFSDAKTQSEKLDRPLVLLVGGSHCRFTPEARQQVESTPVHELIDSKQLVLAYLDVSDQASADVVESRHLKVVPQLLVLSPSGQELWRMSVLDKAPQEFADEIRNVVEGRVSWEQLQAVNPERISDSELRHFAKAAALAERTELAEGLYLRLAEAPSLGKTERREAFVDWATLAIADGDEYVSRLRMVLRKYPEDAESAINLGFSYIRLARYRYGPERSAEMRELLTSIEQNTPAEDTDTLVAAYRLAANYAIYVDETAAEWALPYAEKGLRLNPESEMFLESFAMLSTMTSKTANFKSTVASINQRRGANPASTPPVGVSAKKLLNQAKIELRGAADIRRKYRAESAAVATLNQERPQ